MIFGKDRSICVKRAFVLCENSLRGARKRKRVASSDLRRISFLA